MGAPPFSSRTQLPDINFALRDVTPPSRVYIQRGDRLFVRIYNSVAGAEVTVRGRLLLPNGEIIPFSQPVRPTSDRIATDITLELAEGFLLSLAATRTAGVIRRGQTFVQLSLFRGSGASGERFQILAADYVTLDVVVSFPGGRILSPLDGPGSILKLVGADPAPGAEILQTVPPNVRWRLRSIQAVLTTSATVANRIPKLIIDDGIDIMFVSPQPSVIAASQTVTVVWAEIGAGVPLAGGTQVATLPIDNRLPQGWRISTSTTSLQVGDDYSTVNLWVEEWIEN